LQIKRRTIHVESLEKELVHGRAGFVRWRLVIALGQRAARQTQEQAEYNSQV
jgi:hypothetical protein